MGTGKGEDGKPDSDYRTTVYSADDFVGSSHLTDGMWMCDSGSTTSGVAWHHAPAQLAMAGWHDEDEASSHHQLVHANADNNSSPITGTSFKFSSWAPRISDG